MGLSPSAARGSGPCVRSTSIGQRDTKSPKNGPDSRRPVNGYQRSEPTVNQPQSTPRRSTQPVAILFAISLALLVPTSLLGVTVFASLAAFLMFLWTVAALAVAWSVLERDVAHLAASFTLLSLLLGISWLGPGEERYFATVLFFGAITGALMGDIVRDVRTAGLTGSAVGNSPRWWGRLKPPPNWLMAMGWAAFSISLFAFGGALWFGLTTSAPNDPQSSLLGAVSRDCFVAGGLKTRFVDSAAFSPIRFWCAYLLLIAAFQTVRKVRSIDSSGIRIERLLRRVAYAHSFAILLVTWYFTVDLCLAAADSYPSACGAAIVNFRALPIPLVLFVFTTLMLGRRLPNYLRRHSWSVSVALTAAFASGFLHLCVLLAGRASV
jgi:hypothetical protein